MENTTDIDSCSIEFHIHSHVDTEAKIDAIIAAIDKAGLLSCNGLDTSVELATAPIGQDCPRYCHDGISDEEIEDLEGCFQAMEVSYTLHIGPTDEGVAGCRSWSKEHGSMQSEGMNSRSFLEVVPAIDINVLEEILNKHSGNPEKLEDAIRSFIREARIASGDGLPLFSLSKKAREHLSRISGH